MKVTEEQVKEAGPILSWKLLALPLSPGAAAQGAAEVFHLKCLCTCETIPQPNFLNSWLF